MMMSSRVSLPLVVVVLLLGAVQVVSSFQIHVGIITQARRVLGASSRLYLEVGKKGGDGKKKQLLGPDKNLERFLNNPEESDFSYKMKEKRSAESVPLTYGFEDPFDDKQTTSTTSEPKKKKMKKASTDPTQPIRVEIDEELFEPPSVDVIQNNPYLKVVASLSPTDLISRFTENAHPRVQNAVRTTILGLIGTLPRMAFETKTVTTGARLASLMFQLQMTGYMFKNAEYRLSLVNSIRSRIDPDHEPPLLEMMRKTDPNKEGDDDEVETEDVDPLKGDVKGTLKIKIHPLEPQSDAIKTDLDGNPIPPMEMEVNAAEYMSELRSEVKELRESLQSKQMAQAEAVRKDLLYFIRTLPEKELKSLTGSMSDDVLVAMKGLVSVVLGDIGDGTARPNTIMEQSGQHMAQLLMWQLIVGYNLREMEVRDELNEGFAWMNDLQQEEAPIVGNTRPDLETAFQ